MEPVQPGGLLALLMYEGDSSQGTAARDSRGTSSARREWTDGTIQFLVDMCAEKYFEIDRKQFKKSNWESFAAKLNTQFPEEPQRTWQQTRDKWNKMRSTYAEKKVKQEEIGAPPPPGMRFSITFLVGRLKLGVFLVGLIRVSARSTWRL